MIRTLIHNIHVLFIRDEREIEKRLDELEKELCLCKNRLCQLYKNEIGSKAPEAFKEEARYIIDNGLCNFPYNQKKSMDSIISRFDGEKNLPYVLHNGKCLYFPYSFSLNKCESMYRSYISEECLLGGGYRDKAPHQYQTDKFKIEQGDILVDVGCAEALLALDAIEKVSKVYLIEADKRWIPALKATFESYQEKVELINKYVSDKDSETTITLENILLNEQGKKIFVKMDIEGAEVNVLKGSKEFLSKSADVKIACCTYHREHDAEIILSLLESMGYHTEFSEGYMLFLGDEIKYPYFRHGVLRAWK